MAGRPRVPTALKLLKGTAQPCRMNPDEPTREWGAMPDAPAEMEPYQVAVWEELRVVVDSLRTATTWDVPVFRLLVETVAATRQAMRDPEVTPGEKATLVKTSAHLLGLFGASPAQRAKVSMLPARAAEKDALAEFVR